MYVPACANVLCFTEFHFIMEDVKVSGYTFSKTKASSRREQTLFLSCTSLESKETKCMY